ncbi:MAG: hypothetical protein CSB33_00190 [Desulfobacterales bacterium]|nr:MAG: hypothetical protein CSB33_00190 [Desulfobacterales bacterium]
MEQEQDKRQIRVLVVDDEPDIRNVLALTLQAAGCTVQTAESGERALEIFRETPAEVVLSDIRMPGMDGVSLLHRLKSHDPDVEVIILTGQASVENAVEAFKSGGAFDFLQKPLDDIFQITALVQKAAKRRRLRLANRRMAAELRESERFNDAIIHSLPMNVVVLDREENIIKSNRRRHNFPGESPASSLFDLDTFHDFLYEGQSGCRENSGRKSGHETFLKSYRQVRRHEIDQAEVEICCAFPNEPRWYLIHICRLNTPNEQIIVSRTDITRLKQMEEQVAQSRKMEAVARLASGVAHETRNALVGIMGSIELIEMDQAEGASLKPRHLATIQETAKRISRLSDRLLAYAEKDMDWKVSRDLREIVRDTLDSMRTSIPSRIRVDLELEENPAIASVDANQMHTVLRALIDNAVEAIPMDGDIRISVRTMVIRQNQPAPAKLPVGRYICLAVHDTGAGMEKQVKERIFEPFFSTKFVGRGMSMAAAHGVIRLHDGVIYLESAPEKGTTVHIYLPATPDREEAKSP